MYGKTHVVIALLIVLLTYNYLAYFIPTYKLMFSVGFCLLGSLLPDLDQEYGTIRKPYIALLISAFAFYVLCKANITFYYIIPLFSIAVLLIFSHQSSHRTFTHSLLASLLYTLCILPITIPGSIYFFIGYISHLLADSLTKTGIPFFYPFDESNYGMRVMRVNRLAEKIIFAVGILLCLYLAGRLVISRYSSVF
jgi:inner membrane protein